MTDTIESTEAASTGGSARGAISALRLPELQALAAELGVTGTSKMRKSDLMDAIKNQRGARRPRTAEPTEPTSQGELPVAAPRRTRSARTAPAEPVRDEVSTHAEPLARHSTDLPVGLDAVERTLDVRLAAGETRDERAARALDAIGAVTGERRSRRSGRGAGAPRLDVTGGEAPTDAAPRAESPTDRTEAPVRQPRQESQAREPRQNRDGGQGREASQGRDVGLGRENAQARDGGQARDGSQNRDGGQSGANQGQGNQGLGPEDDERGGRRRRSRDRYRDRDRTKRGGRVTRSPGGDLAGYEEVEVSEDDVLLPVAGILDIHDQYGFVRTSGYLPGPNDVYVSLGQVKKAGLRRGDAIMGAVRQQREGEPQPQGTIARAKFNALVRLDSVNGQTPEEARQRPDFSKLTPLYPQERLRLENDPTKVTPRVIDIVAPIGKGQRGLIVSPPKAGKTIIMQQIANAITANNPEVHLMVVLVDERP
ncbi:MAG: transcription termination factor Rho, partial [Cellulomonadaceae bacterium]|nr:transcription termination factor Rho [Cellulomonadaceae bacterium]